MDTDWIFDEPPNLAVITLKRILNEDKSVLHVIHDEDGDWQFLDGQFVAEEDAMVVGLGNMLKFDPTLAELADLPKGWLAERSVVDGDWQRSQLSQEELEDDCE